MDSTSGRATKLESAIGICLLAILFLIAVTILIKQSDYDMGRFGIEKAVDESITATLRSLAPAGFEMLSEEVYHADNLFEKINGKAPLYIESGFEKLFTQRLINKENKDLWMELFIFDMASLKNAFSVYSVQRRPNVQFLPDMQFGYRTADSPYFVHGKYYVEFIASSKSDELYKAIMEVAHNIQTNLPADKDEEIPELTLFPQDNLVTGSPKLYLASAFGFEGFTDIFTAQYKLGEEIITAFFSKRPDSKEAQLVAKSYYDFLLENGGELKTAINKTLEGKVFDFYDTTEIVSAAGPFVYGIHEAESQKSAEKIAITLLNKLGKGNK
ncbi:MAG: hypothetical protein GWN55_14455 [Phycisphaerae bacterium]|nr:hypothetical protein [Phycisphaerae bacterium]NIV02497.1 hypothetical protein [Phycisphaerae bacterium]NIW98022.1 hypothetical protein [Phycisphaerae bacterium]